MGGNVQMAAHLMHPPGAYARRHSRSSSQQRNLRAPVLQLLLLLQLSRHGEDSQLACRLSMCLQHLPRAHRVCQELYCNVTHVCLIPNIFFLDAV